MLHHQTDVAADYTCAYLKFDVPAGEKLTIRTASSFISPEQAAINFNREVADADVQLISGKAREQWNNYLGRVEAEGGTDEQLRTFYSCLYRTLLFPREFYEFDSQGNPVYYSPYDGNVHDGYMYTDNGFWDTFRAVHPLFTLLYPEVSERVTQSIINAYNESGFMPEWASPGHRGCMIGNNSVSLLVDAWMKGIQTVDAEKALEAMIHQTQARHAEIASVGRDGFRISQTSIIRKPRITAICIIRNMVLCGLRMPKAIGVIVLMLRNGAVLSQKEVPGTGLGVYFTIRKVYLN